jgi:hypothetical protein
MAQQEIKKIYHNRFLKPAFEAIHEHSSSRSYLNYVLSLYLKEGPGFDLEQAKHLIKSALDKDKKNFDEMYEKYKNLAIEDELTGN